MAAAVLAGSSQLASATPKKPAKKAKPAAKAKKQPVHRTKYGAHAVGVDLTNSLTGATWRFGRSGRLHPHGGSLDAVVGATNLADLLSVGGVHVSASGIGGVTASRAEVTNFSLAIVQDGLTNVLAFAYAAAEALAECGSNGVVLTANSQVQGLTIDGVPLSVTGETNQTIAIPGGTLVLNSQLASVSGNGQKGESAVAALFISLTNGLQATIAYAEAQVKCGSSVPAGMRACDKITGGGFVHTSLASTNGATNNLSRGGFNLNAGNKRGVLVGKLNYIDHGSGIRVNSTAITSFTVIDLVTRAIDFDVLIDGLPGTARVLVADNGEPGGNDIFDIVLSTGYHAGGALAGGNIQSHKCPPGWSR